LSERVSVRIDTTGMKTTGMWCFITSTMAFDGRSTPMNFKE